MDKPPKLPWLVRLLWALERRRGAWALPARGALGDLLYYGPTLIGGAWSVLLQALVREPALRHRCTSVGRRPRLWGPIPRIMGPGEIVIGDEVEIGIDCSFLVGLESPTDASLHIGNRASIGPHCLICVDAGVRIGEYSRLGAYVRIYDTDVHTTDALLRRDTFGNAGLAAKAPVIIEDDVWIGIGATILKGVTLGRGAIVGAGAVVTRDVPAGAVAAGNPAVIVGRADAEGSAARSMTSGAVIS